MQNEGVSGAVHIFAPFGHDAQSIASVLTGVGLKTTVHDSLSRLADALDDGVQNLRHTFASWLVMAGVSLYQVQKLMRHTTITMTERYAHLAPDTLQGAVNVIDQRPEPAETAKAEGER